MVKKQIKKGKKGTKTTNKVAKVFATNEGEFGMAELIKQAMKA